MDSYNSDGNDPLKLNAIINSLRRELREERFKRHELQTSTETLTHKVARLQHANKNSKQSHHYESSNDEDDNNSNEDNDDEYLIRRLQSRARHLFSALKRCQAERDDLKVSNEGSDRIKEWMDGQLASLEEQNERLQTDLFNTRKELDDSLTQNNADSKMKDWISKEWESARLLSQELEIKCESLIDQKRDLIVQINADATMKEYLAGQLEVLEEKQKNLPVRRVVARGRY